MTTILIIFLIQLNNRYDILISIKKMSNKVRIRQVVIFIKDITLVTITVGSRIIMRQQEKQ
jgi:hypothetical protein